MMNTIAGEGTNSEGREVTMTVHESGKTDAEMNGMKGMEQRCKKKTILHPEQFNLMGSDTCLASPYYLFHCFYREWDRGRERRSRGEYRDYERGRRERFTPPRHDMSPQQKRMRREW